LFVHFVSYKVATNKQAS